MSFAKRGTRVLAVVVLTAVALVLAGVLLPGRTTTPTGGVAAIRADLGVVGAGTAASADANITALQARADRLPGDWNAWAGLGFAYVERARLTADPTAYALAEDAFARSFEARPGNDQALAGRAGLAAARHDFAAALADAEAAVAINPSSAAGYSVLADALIELGRYEEAFDAVQRMVDLRPGLSSYSRVSYTYELRGDTVRAIEAMTAARDSATTGPEIAFAEQLLGKLTFDQGQLDVAAGHFDAALRALANYPPALVGQARVAAARGDLDGAIAAWEDITANQPLPEYVAAYAEVLTAAGRHDDAADQYEVLGAIRALFVANGVNVDIDIALAEANRGVEPGLAVTAARAEWARRESIHVADALAWALHAAGADAEALPYADRALALGTRDATFTFHRAAILDGLGRADEAAVAYGEALAINPAFSPRWAPVATARLRALGAS